MNKATLIFILLIVFISCKEKPTYNPFDDQFNVSVRQLVRDKRDTISAGCGYFNLRKNSGRFRPYYQIYADDFHEVVAKGFDLYIDTFKTQKPYDKPFVRQQMDSILDLPINRKIIDMELGKFGYRVISRDSSIIKIANKATNDTVTERIETFTTPYHRYITRGITYFKSPPTNHKHAK